MQYLPLLLLSFALSFTTSALGDQEKSLLVSTKVAHETESVLKVPCETAELHEWASYVTALWNTDCSSAHTGLLAVDGTPIDILSKTWLQYDPCFKKCCVWELKRSHDWQEAIGRVAKVKGITKVQYAGIVLVVKDFSKEKVDLLNAEIACEALEFGFQTIDISGVIRGTTPK